MPTIGTGTGPSGPALCPVNVGRRAMDFKGDAWEGFFKPLLDQRNGKVGDVYAYPPTI